jgi:hypothetical protein
MCSAWARASFPRTPLTFSAYSTFSPRGERGEEVELLKDESDLLLSDRREVARGVRAIAVHENLAARRGEDAPEDGQERRLPRSARSFERHDLATRDVEAHPAQHVDRKLSLPEGLGHLTRG